MSYASIRMEKLTPHIGAEVLGVDLAQPLAERTFKTVHDALIENCVIFFRDQQGSPSSSTRPSAGASASWRIHPAAPGLGRGAPGDSRHPRRREVQAGGRRGTGTPTSPAMPSRPWGAFSTCTSCRRWAAIRCSPACTRPTTGLSEPLKRMLEGMTAIHRGEHVYRGTYGVGTIATGSTRRRSIRSSAPIPSRDVPRSS